MLKAAQQKKRSADDAQPEGDKPTKRGRPKAKGQAKAKGAKKEDHQEDAEGPSGAKDGAASEVVEEDKVEEDKVEGDKVEGDKVEGDKGDKVDGEVEGDRPAGRRVRESKPKVSLEVLETAWKEKAGLVGAGKDIILRSSVQDIHPYSRLPRNQPCRWRI